MVIHDRFVFLQVRKTGCTFIADMLRRELPADALDCLGKHTGWNHIPSEAAGRPVLAYIRNPWDWYVSWYYWHLRYGVTRSPPFKELSLHGELDFPTTVQRACTHPKLAGRDLYSFFFMHQVGWLLDSKLLTIGRFESLIDDLEGFLSEVGAPLADDAFIRIRTSSPVNASDHGPYRGHYDAELRELVGESCRPLIERFGYQF